MWVARREEASSERRVDAWATKRRGGRGLALASLVRASENVARSPRSEPRRRTFSHTATPPNPLCDLPQLHPDPHAPASGARAPIHPVKSASKASFFGRRHAIRNKNASLTPLRPPPAAHLCGLRCGRRRQAQGSEWKGGWVGGGRRVRDDQSCAVFFFSLRSQPDLLPLFLLQSELAAFIQAVNPGMRFTPAQIDAVLDEVKN